MLPIKTMLIFNPFVNQINLILGESEKKFGYSVIVIGN